MRPPDSSNIKHPSGGVNPRTVGGGVPKIRAAAIADVPTIHHLLDIDASKGNLLPRTLGELYRHLRDFFVLELDA